MSDLFLTADEMHKLTGLKQPSKQVAWLRRYGLRFFVAADGHPRVPRSNFEAKENQRVNVPDFSALKKTG